MPPGKADTEAGYKPGVYASMRPGEMPPGKPLFAERNWQPTQRFNEAGGNAPRKDLLLNHLLR